MNTINTLGYAILGALGRKPCSGYELAQYLEVVRPVKHSQIYPMLTKMEQKDLLVHVRVDQTGKPDKKIFSITEKGKETLQKWLAKSPSDPINRDEFLIKIYSIWMMGEENSMELVQDRISNLEETLTYLSKKIAELEQNKELGTMSKNFGRYILFNRKFRLAKEEKTWCQWVLNLIKNKNLNIPILCVSARMFGNLVEEVVLVI
ncbi:PadR family transcriptional regulator [Peribacillus muralis]|uniref:PadR family transcriptional regulator n=1 Tax=Peribacillus muralis TaxID=264697 RepID=UPI00070FD9E7|nr:PadR family transcriptional regulator [Peribacillus muralis]